MALWDLAGRILNRPVASLLVGKFTTAFVPWPRLSSIWRTSTGRSTNSAGAASRATGVLKAGWGMRPEAVFGQDRRSDIEIVRLVREVIGAERELVVDTPGVRGIWDVPTAIQRFHDLEPYRLNWIEQPLLPRDLPAHARLQGRRQHADRDR